MIWGRVIGSAVLVTVVALYVGNAEHNRGRIKLLQQAAEVQDGIIQRQSAQLRSQNERIANSNARWNEQLAAERLRLIQAKAEAERVKRQRDLITAELAASRKDWQEAVAHDPNLAEFVAHPVPPAVWGRLRRAAGG